MKLITGLLFLLVPGLVIAKGVSLELNAVPLPQALNMIYVQVFDKPFMLDPELAKSDKVVTFRITPDIDERAFIKRYLGNMNIAIYNKQASITWHHSRLKRMWRRRKPLFIGLASVPWRICRIFWPAVYGAV
ncbi:hypothetical protein [Citrobacter koseri]|uniref:hypothetical protein n=1 Tax=Citrobacter koseri TaxID=545 RepID=UPI000B04DBAB|nr:hypothetical protein [Citrobacter koseri]